jgi:hypothetical protein
MNFLGEVENISYDLVDFVGFVELGIPTQLVILSFARVESMHVRGFATCICCMVSTIDFFSLFFASQSIVVLFFLSSQSLHTCSLVALFQMVTWTSTYMLIEVLTTLISTIG